MEYRQALKLLAHKSLSKDNLADVDLTLTIVQVLKESGIRIGLTSEPQAKHKAYIFETDDFDSSLTTAIEELHRLNYKVLTNNVGDYFTIKASKNNGDHKVISTFAFEYNVDNSYGERDKTVLISSKPTEVSDA